MARKLFCMYMYVALVQGAKVESLCMDDEVRSHLSAKKIQLHPCGEVTKYLNYMRDCQLYVIDMPPINEVSLRNQIRHSVQNVLYIYISFIHAYI